MGLCKCPKKILTSQFCFQHQVNVCDFCIVNSHSKCHVKTLTDWLHSNNYPTTCVLCEKSFEEDDCVRLLNCYDLLHKRCLVACLTTSKSFDELNCPVCMNKIFIKNSSDSPLAYSLIETLKGVPVIDEYLKQNKAEISSNEFSPSPITNLLPRKNPDEEYVKNKVNDICISLESLPTQPLPQHHVYQKISSFYNRDDMYRKISRMTNNCVKKVRMNCPSVWRHKSFLIICVTLFIMFIIYVKASSRTETYI